MLCFGCQDNLTDSLDSLISAGTATDDKELLPRSLSMPDVNRLNEIYASKSRATSSPIIGNSDILLGKSYKAGNGIIGDFNNVVFPIIDLDKVRETGANRIMAHSLKQQNEKICTYSDFYKFADSASVVRTISSGFRLNLMLFTIGRKNTTTEIFKTAYTSSEQSVYGELNIIVRDRQFRLESTSSSRRLYARQCLTNEFKDALYCSTIGDIINQYGPYVLIGYDTGGKAMALYAGKSKTGASYHLHERDLRDTIDASFEWEKDNDVSASLKFKLNNGSVSTNQSSLKDVLVQVRTYGGDNINNAVVGPVEIDKLSVDLTSWLKSLSDEDKHTIIDIADEGLMPISAFVLEKNFQNRFDDTTEDYLEPLYRFNEPYIEVVRVYARSSNGQRLYEIAPVLNTRQGDKIVLSNGAYSSLSDAQLQQNSDNQVYLSSVMDIALQKRKYFNGIRCVQNVSTYLDPRERNPVCIRMDKFDETKAYRWLADNNMVYIYMPEAKIAFSYYISEWDEDAVLDDYGIRDWVENLPEKKIAVATLANYYTIIGL